MPRTHSQLFYTRIRDEASFSPTIITLHKHNQYGPSLAEFARAAAPQGRLIGLESYKGIFVGREIVGYTWFLGPLSRPAPVFFGDALAEIERFLWDERERQGVDDVALPFLLGVEQGAIMALAAAAAVPDLLSGVIAIEGRFPVVPGWDPPLAPLDDLPMLIIDPENGIPEHADVLTGEPLGDSFRQWGAQVTRSVVPDITTPSDSMQNWLSKQTIRTARNP